MHREAFAAVANMVRTLPIAPRQVYEIGSREVKNGGVKELITQIWPGIERYWGIDLVDGPGVDLVADASTYEPPFTPDLVVCCEVFEHTILTEAIISQVARLLAPGGFLVATCAGPTRPPHSAEGDEIEGDEFYHGVEIGELHKWCTAAGLVEVEVAVPEPQPPHTNIEIETIVPEGELTLQQIVNGMDRYLRARKPLEVPHE